MSEVCKTSGPLVDHPSGSATGSVEQLSADMRCYRTGSGTKVGIVAAYDIFGFDVEQTRLFCDELAAATGGTVVMPDYFRGNSWKAEKFPIQDQEEWQTWIKEVADGEKARRDTLELVQPYMRRVVGADTPLAIVGFCWGAWVGTITIGDAKNPFCCAVGLHPSKQSAEDVGKIRVPLALFPAENDGDMSEYFKAIPDKQLAAKCRHKIFVGTRHGWCTKRVDLSDTKLREKVQEANSDTAQFILQQL